ncbi:MAG: ABC transporter permease [Cyclobacteriaceae bacterium]|nr:ABC transporter permease [Cyclobacteriaceae bacterium]
MLKNYYLVALRTMRKHKLFSIINIVGLVIGMTCCLLIFVYVQDELSYDRFHKDSENIYRVALHGRISGQEITTTSSSLPLANTMLTEIPGVDDVIRLRPANGGGGMAFRYENMAFLEDKIFYADSNFYNFFSFKLLKGNANTALREPNSVVITEAIAKKYFGNEEPLGKTLVIGNSKWACKVTGITAEAPSNSHFHFNGIISFVTVEKDFFPGWTGNSWQTYLKKNPNTPAHEINTKLESVVEKYVGKELEEGLGISLAEFHKQGGLYSYYIYPLVDSHLKAGLPDDIEPSGNMSYVYIFWGVGIFILLIACINFMNLSTARSAGRAKEVGLRKTLGSARRQMVFQFLSESFMYSLIALALALTISFLVLPQFNLLAGKQLSLDAFLSPLFMGTAMLLLILVGVVAGSYPALYLTSFKPVEVLKGKARAGMKSKGVRSSLVIFQFAVSTFLIIATVVVFNQLNFMQSKNLGLDKQNVVVVSGTSILGSNREAFKSSLLEQTGIQSASYTNNTFPGMDNTTVLREKGKDLDHLVGKYNADWDHLDVMKFTLLEGRFFSREFATDTAAAVINEAAVKEYGFQNPVGEELLDFNSETPETVHIIGVVKDFNFETLQSKVRPLVIRFTDVSRNLLVRYEGDPRQALSVIESSWKSLVPGEPFQYTFLDQNFDSLFRSEMRLRDIFVVFSSLAIFIACLGLFALAAFTTEQRTKEIGVRKAMGASVFSLTLLLSKEFTRLVLIAIVPAVAAGWYVANWWLEGFVYRTELSPVIFIGCALLAIVIAWVTVSFQSVKAAKINPVNSLRYE